MNNREEGSFMDREDAFDKSLWGRFIRRIDQHMNMVCLVSTTLQMTFIYLFLRYTKIDVVDNYIPSVSVIFVELVKIVFCLIVSYFELRGKLISTIFSGGVSHLLKMSIPAILYAIQNNLTHYSLARIEAPHFQVIYQFRIILTALFSMILLNKSYTRLKWVSLISLFLGVVLAQIDSYVYSEKISLVKTASIIGDDPYSVLKGIISTMCGALTSALGGVYTEKMLKESTSSLWMTNIQLCSLSMLVSIVMSYWVDSALISEKGLFFGWNYTISILVLNQAIGGLLIASVLFFSDSVTKTYAGCITLVLISISNVFLFEVPIHSIFVVGALIVMVATYYYSLPDDTQVYLGRFKI